MMLNQPEKQEQGRAKKRRPWLRVVSILLVVSILSSVTVSQFNSISKFLTGIAESDPLSRIYSILQGEITDPSTYEDYYELAAIAIRTGEYDTALTQLNQCLSLADETDATQMADVWTLIGSVYFMKGEMDSAESAFDKVLTYDAANAQAVLYRAQINLERQDYEAAAGDLEEYLTLLPEDSSVYEKLAQIKEALGDYAGAQESYEALYALEPEDASHLLNSLRCASLAGKYEEAIAGLDAYLADTLPQTQNAETTSPQPENTLETQSVDTQTLMALRATALYMRAACKMETGAYEDAVSDLQSAVDSGYDAVICNEQMVTCYFAMENYEKAVEVGSTLLDKSASLAAADQLYQRLGIAQMQLENYADAVDLLTESINLNPDAIGSYYYRALVLMELEKLDEAIQDLTKSIEQEFLVQYCYYNRGVCYVQLLDYDSAIGDMEMTLQTGDVQALKDAATNVLWQLAQYYENQSAAQVSGEQIIDDVESITE